MLQALDLLAEVALAHLAVCKLPVQLVDLVSKVPDGASSLGQLVLCLSQSTAPVEVLAKEISMALLGEKGGVGRLPDSAA